MHTYSNLAILVPCHNEQENLATLIPELKITLPGSQLILIDNGSTDETYKIASNIGGITLLKEARIGKAMALKKGLAALGPGIDLIAIIDADLTYSPRDLKNLVEEMIQANEAAMIVGNRLKKTEGFGLFNFLFNKIVAILVNLHPGAQVKDLLSGLRVWRKSLFHAYQIKGQSFEFETEITLHFIHEKKIIVYSDIEYTKRLYGKSKIHPIKDAFLILAVILKSYLPQKR